MIDRNIRVRSSVIRSHIRAVSRPLYSVMLALTVFFAWQPSVIAVGTPATRGELEHVQLLLSYKDSIAFLSVLVAKELYFEKQGLDVETVPSHGSAYDIRQLIAENFDFAVVSAQSVAIGAIKDPAIKAIAVLDKNAITISAPRSSSIRSLADLAGKKVGVADLGSGEVAFLKALFSEANLADKIKLVAVGPGGPAVDRALRNGRIAAFGGFINDMAGIEAAGLQLRSILPARYHGLPSNVLASRQGVLDTDAGQRIAVKLIQALSQATQFAAQHPRRALEIACKYAPSECIDMQSARVFEKKVIQSEKAALGPTFGMFDYDHLKQLVDTLKYLPRVSIKSLDLRTAFTNRYVKRASDSDGT